MYAYVHTLLRRHWWCRQQTEQLRLIAVQSGLKKLEGCLGRSPRFPYQHEAGKDEQHAHGHSSEAGALVHDPFGLVRQSFYAMPQLARDCTNEPGPRGGLGAAGIAIE